MATPADEKIWKSIFTEVTTFMTTATHDEKQKLLIGIAKVNARRCIRKKNGKFNTRIYALSKQRTVGTYLNEEEATLAVAIAKTKLGPKKPYRKSAAQKLKELVRVNTICVVDVYPNISVVI